MKENLEMENPTVKEKDLTTMEMFMKESGKMGREMVKGK